VEEEEKEELNGGGGFKMEEATMRAIYV